MTRKVVFLEEIQLQIYEAFVSQDPDLFDVVFEIKGKKLYADKMRLSVVSSTFKSMLSNRWSFNKNEPIKIINYEYDDFKEFLTFIYCGECNLTDENIYHLMDMAEFYQISHLLRICDEYLSKTKIDLDNILDLFEISSKYSVVKFKQMVDAFIITNFKNLIFSGTFVEAKKSTIEELINMKFNVTKSEEFFKAVYQWSEYQAKKKQNESDDGIVNLKDAIKNEISPFLHYFDLKATDKRFLKPFLADKQFLFSGIELCDILNHTVTKFVKVKVTNSLGQSISGSLPADSEATEIIKSLKDRLCDFPFWWKTENKFPAYPSPLYHNPEVEWYLIYFSNGDIGVKKGFQFGINEFLLAEMKVADTSSDFVYSNKCRIEIE